MKAFKVLLFVIPSLIILALIIVAIPYHSDGEYVFDEMGDIGAFDDPTALTSSKMSFFSASAQISNSKQVRKPDPVSYIKMSNAVVSTDYKKNNISIVKDIDSSYTGPVNVVMYNGEVEEFEAKDKSQVTLKSGVTVASDETFSIILPDGLIGSKDRIPHRIIKGNTYYAAFTSEHDAIYFEFTALNEFVSIKLGNLASVIEYTLLNGDMEPIKNGLNGGGASSLEIQYKGKKADKYYLKISGSYEKQLAPFSVSISSDQNEWLWQMGYPALTEECAGKLDYYGDEDFFVLPNEVTSDIDRSVIRFSKAGTSMNVIVRDKKGNKVGSFIYKPGETGDISMLGLENAFAVSLYSCDGASAGTEYAFSFTKTKDSILGIETYGIQLSPKYSEDEDYYTASVSSIASKKITGILSIPKASAEITVTQQCGYKAKAKLDTDLPLSKGRNTVTLSIKAGTVTRDITIVITDKSYGLMYGYMTKSDAGISSGTKVLIVDEKPSEVQVQLCSGTNIGKLVWVKKSCIFSGYEEVQMPDAYKEQINTLKKSHPNWKFTFVKTGQDFNTYAKSQLGEASILNSKQATLDEIKYYIDPRNFLNDKNIFMFEKQTYTEGIYSDAGIMSVWNDSTYCSYISEAAASTLTSPYFIVARSALESGRGTSKLASGGVTGYEGYYNFYGIGANDSNPSNGAVVAKNNNWNTKRRAIIEGAAWVKDQYISCQQYTIYFFKFSFVPNRGWHQYMTDIAAPKKDSVNYYNAHSSGGTLGREIEFVIPVFDNLP